MSVGDPGSGEPLPRSRPITPSTAGSRLDGAAMSHAYLALPAHHLIIRRLASTWSTNACLKQDLLRDGPRRDPDQPLDLCRVSYRRVID